MSHYYCSKAVSYNGHWHGLLPPPRLCKWLPRKLPWCIIHIQLSLSRSPSPTLLSINVPSFSTTLKWGLLCLYICLANHNGQPISGYISSFVKRSRSYIQLLKASRSFLLLLHLLLLLVTCPPLWARWMSLVEPTFNYVWYFSNWIQINSPTYQRSLWAS